MHRRSFFRLTITLALAMVVLSAQPAFAAMSRSLVMSRAEQWVSKRIPYSQTGWANLNGDIVSSPSLGWRRDCSGFASMCWNLPKPGASTRTWAGYAEPTTKAALQPGDALVSYNNHAVIFGGWANDEHTHYIAYEMSSSASKTSTPTPDGTITRITPYPYWNWPYDRPYLPYRLPGIVGNIDYSGFITPVEGTDRYRTAIAASGAAFADGSAETAVVASGENWPDALGASALAGAVDGPVLLTMGGSLHGALPAELARLGVSEVVLVGGTAAVSPAVEAALDALPGVSVTRVGGTSRYDTARLLAEETTRRVTDAGGTPDGGVFIATGTNFPDALAASPLAWRLKRPIVLTDPAALSRESSMTVTAAWVDEAYILGGTGPVSTAVEDELVAALGEDAVRRIAGRDRYSTGLALAAFGHDECGLSYAGAAVATGENFPDALAGGAMAGKLGTVLLLTPSARLDAGVADLMLEYATEFGVPHCLGGDSALLPIVREAIALSVGTG